MKRYILLCVGLLYIGVAQAQIHLRIDPQALGNIDGNTYHLNDSTPTGLTATVTLSNNSNATFTDSLSFGYSIANGGVVNTYNTRNYAGSGISANGPVAISITAGSSFTYQSLIFHITSPVFVIGPTTVVIWPTLYQNGSSIGDSASANIIIDNPAGIASVADGASEIYISGGELVIRNPGNSFGGIRIFDVAGQLLVDKMLGGEGSLPMAQYADGAYIVETITKQGDHRIYKVMKQTPR